jgi:hypothetical protein
MAELN